MLSNFYKVILQLLRYIQIHHIVAIYIKIRIRISLNIHMIMLKELPDDIMRHWQ